ncbi:Prp28p [Sugiyamaella lignohabitans]|uniref:RNA helicase n=1 Tax=Sugiyamaella lignohabitans TaxID=796027 RepID=A0A167DKT1_9ASCO|nr:Prp28p [Sugiyamaella lignohabitans]ANB13023.1 Prp28p [Sugiyamaella lignohabitans]
MAVPLSVEELVQKKKAEAEQSSKPKFLSRAQREKLALERRVKEVGKSQVTTNRSAVPVRHNEKPEVTESEANSQATEGTQTNKSVRLRERTKFRFGWEANDDTLNESDELYQLAAGNANIANLPPGAGFEERKRRQQEIDRFKNKRSRTDIDDIHWTRKSLDEMKDRDWRIFKEDYKIVTKSIGPNKVNFIRFWHESGLPPTILDTIKELKYKEPTAIQRAAIPIALQHKDVIGIAETGSGKTASFVIPMLVYVMGLPPITEESKANGPYSIILAPTRELAQQIEAETIKFARPLGMRCVSLVGGRSIEEQAFNLQDGAEIIIATPGRLVDCIERRIVALNQCCYVIMDEADRMVDLGFEEQLNKILDALPVSNEKPSEADDDIPNNKRGTTLGKKYRQTMMYTATWPKAIERMAERYLRNPGIVTIGSLGQATDRVEQRVEYVNGEEKRKKRMLDILNKEGFTAPIIIFVNLRRNCDVVAKALQSEGWKAATMHGSKSQEQREQALSQLRLGTIDCLVATDVAGRGIDVPDISLVINFQMSKSIEAYTHRIGRTGRAGKSGVAITFVGDEDEAVLYDLKVLLQKSGVHKMPQELRQAVRRAPGTFQVENKDDGNDV